MLATRLVDKAWKATPYAKAWGEGKASDESYIMARDVFFAGAIEMLGLLSEAAREKSAVKRLAIELEVSQYAIDKLESFKCHVDID